jgi:creatinine amidohydrolase
MFLCSCIWYQALDQKKFFEHKDDHGGEMETSLILYLTPHLVRPLSEAGDGAGRKFKFTAMKEGWAWAERKWPEVTNDTGVGDPRKATPEKGEKFFEALTAKVADFFVEVAKAKAGEMYEG